jgi:hypothetical protein
VAAVLLGAVPVAELVAGPVLPDERGDVVVGGAVVGGLVGPLLTGRVGTGTVVVADDGDPLQPAAATRKTARTAAETARRNGEGITVDVAASSPTGRRGRNRRRG